MPLLAIAATEAYAWALLATIGALAVALGWLFEKLIIAFVRRLAASTRTELDDLVIRALHPALAVLVVVLAVQAGLTWFGPSLPPRPVAIWRSLNFATGVLVVAIMGARLAGGLLQHSTNRHRRFAPVARLGTRIVNVVVYVVAFLLILDTYGVSITPLVTSLGIAGLAVALALQDTLANFFAGVWIQTGNSLQPGNYIRLENEKLEGYVEEVGWRTTKIRQLSNNTIIVPNAKFAQSIITDFNLPSPRMPTTVTIGVAFEADPRAVIAILTEEANALVKEVPGVLADPAPSVRLNPGFGESSVVYSVSVHVREFVDQFLAQHELRLRILERLRREGIRIPYPTREVIQLNPSAPQG